MQQQRTTLPTPQATQYCCQGPAWLYWSVPQKVVHMQVPDMTCAIRTDIVTLSGVYQLEANRFDAATRFLPWSPYFQPNEGQKKSINKFLRYFQATLADIGGPAPYPGIAGSTGRYHCLYAPGPYVLCRCPRIGIPQGSTAAIIPDHPRPVGVPPSFPLNTHSPHSLDPHGGQPVYPVTNPGITFQDGNPPTVSFESLRPQPQVPMNLHAQATHPQVEGQAMDTSDLTAEGPNPGTQIKITQV